MADGTDISALLAALDSTTQEFAEFRDEISNPIEGASFSAGPSPGPSGSISLSKIDALLGALNAKQQEWETNPITNTISAPGGAKITQHPSPSVAASAPSTLATPSAAAVGNGQNFTPASQRLVSPSSGASRLSGMPTQTINMNTNGSTVIYPANHRGSIAGAPVGTVQHEIATAQQRENEAQTRIKQMHEQFERTKQAGHTRWVRRGSESVKLNISEVKALIDQGVDVEEFTGVHDVGRTQSTQLNALVQPGAAHQSAPAAVNSPTHQGLRASGGIRERMATFTSPPPQARQQTDPVSPKSVATPKFIAVAPSPTPVLASQQSPPLQRVATTPLTSFPGGIKRPISPQPTQQTSVHSQPLAQQHPHPQIQHHVQTPQWQLLQVAPPQTQEEPIKTLAPVAPHSTQPVACHLSTSSAPIISQSTSVGETDTEVQQGVRLHSGQRTRGPTPTPVPAPTISVDENALDEILGILDGAVSTQSATSSPIKSATALATPEKSRTSVVLAETPPGQEPMRKSLKVLAMPPKDGMRVQISVARPPVAEPPRSTLSPPPRPQMPPSLQLTHTIEIPSNASPLMQSALKAAAVERARLDAGLEDELWVFDDKPAPSPLAEQAILQRRSSFNFPHEVALPKISIQVTVPHLYRTFDLSIDPGQSIASLKLFLWVEVFQRQNITVGGHLTNYLFRAGIDDYFLDEKILIRDAPFFIFCAQRKFSPTVFLVQRNELDKLNKSIEEIIEASLLMTEEANQFRREMHRIVSAVMTKHYRRLPFLSTFEPASVESSSVWPQAFPVQIFVPEDNNPNSSQPPERRTVAVPFRGTARRIISSVQSDFPYLFEFKSEVVDDYVLKVRGLQEYFVGEMQLIASEYIRDCIRKRRRVDLIVIEKAHLEPEAAALVAHFAEMLMLGKQQSSLVEIETLLSRDAHSPNLHFSSLALDRPLRVFVKSVEPIPFDSKLFNAPKKRTDLVQLYVSCEVRHVGSALGVLMRSTKQFFYEDAKEPIKFDSWLDMPSYCVLPRASVLRFEVHALYRDKDTVIGWAEHQLYDSRGVIVASTFSRGLWLMAGEHSAAQQPDSGSALLEQSAGPKLVFSIEDMGKPVVFPQFSYKEWKAENPNIKDEVPPPPLIKHLSTIIAKDALQPLEREEKVLLWQYRAWCKTQPHATAKLVLSVPWARPGSAVELYRLLHEWTQLPPMVAIELLNKNFIDPEIRAFAVRNLHRLSDDELADILLQLVQALKHELDHDSFLARFLIIRAIYNPFQIGNFFFWSLIASMHQKAYRERFEVVLEVFLRYCSNFRETLASQLVLFKKLNSFAVELKTVKDARRKQFLDDKLEHLSLTTPFQIPISCRLLAKGFRIERCKNLDSKTLPLWLVCENVDRLGDPLTFILKVGDDLRQDQLTVQMFRIMDRLWLSAGLDLKMSPYTVLDAGAETGMIEVVSHAATSAAIQKQYGGVKAAFSEKPLLEWLKKHNHSESELKNAIRDFVHSCAGYCVSTYVLGIGDRHNDNIMCTKSGLLFHIDFGRFLGNTEKFAGVSRDRAPFVFTPEFLYAMGGSASPLFKQFVDLCCKAYNVLRKHANIFINLFAMMLSTGIPELRAEADINYLRDAFSLDLTDEEASKKFEGLISESLKSKATQFNFAIHIMAHPEKDG